MSLFNIFKKENTKSYKEFNIKDIVKSLDSVIDPETNISITDLGLIYDIKIINDEVKIKMTMTTPICPMASYLIDSATESIKEITDKNVDIDLIWEPRWNREMVSEEVKNYLV